MKVDLDLEDREPETKIGLDLEDREPELGALGQCEGRSWQSPLANNT